MIRLLLIATCARPLAAAAVVLAAPPAHDGTVEFQRAIGGLGLGPAADTTRCRPMFDPRIDRACSWRFEPIPGADNFCPCHR